MFINFETNEFHLLNLFTTFCLVRVNIPNVEANMFDGGRWAVSLPTHRLTYPLLCPVQPEAS